ncbi:MAG: LysR family transcriptional regulator [Lachnospiraceae bacterium]|nr:LysR family transcriptional regulator [Lachnospiraceae bacterium]
MTLYQLEQFKVVAELQHMTRAAEVLSTTQPALSRSMKNLEAEYDTIFFDHVGKNIVLNEKGQIFLKYVTQVLNSMHMAKHEINQQIEKEDTSVNLVIQAGGMIIADIIRKFTRIHPEVHFDIIQYDSWLLKSQQPDLVLYPGIAPQMSDSCCTLLKEDILLAIPADHPLAQEKEVHLAQIAQAPLVGIQKGSLIAAHIQYFYRSAGFEPNFIMDHYTSTSLSDMISIGMGFAFIPSLTWPGIANEHVKLVRIADVDFHRYVILS